MCCRERIQTTDSEFSLQEIKLTIELTLKYCNLVTWFNNWGASKAPGNGVSSFSKNPGKLAFYG